ncbi:hypothetical protein C8F04DRAFT_968656, partial [Mycena alexandri]
MRRTVIDYVICSKSLFDDIESFTVCNRVPGYDHAATILRIKLNFVAQTSLSVNPRKKRKIDFTLPDDTELDKLFIATLAAGKDEQKKLLNLYGAVTSTTARVKVTIHGVCINAGKNSASAAAATYWGPEARLNSGRRVHGSQTSARAELLAVILALEKCPAFKSMEISTRSEYAIRSVVYYAAHNEACGWRCANGDLLKILIGLIKSRTAPVHFSHIK